MMNKNKTIGILTWHYYNNFGSALQSFALQTILESLGYNSEFINYRNPNYGKGSSRNEIVKTILLYIMKFPFFRIERFLSGRLFFELKYLKCGRLTQNCKELPSLSSKYYAIVCGSDQIWAPNCYNPVYFAAFANKGIRKVSYAASIGLNDIPEELVPKYKEHLSDFFAVGVREEKGQEILRNRCDVDSTVVLDPTLLLEWTDYTAIERTPFYQPNGRYLFVYLLNENHSYKDKIVAYAKEKDLKIVGVSAKMSDEEWMISLSNLGADQFIWLVHHAEAVMTDSYHGTIFSLLFHKNVYTFQRFAENDPINQNSRIRQLEKNFGLNGHIMSLEDDIDDSKAIDYDYFDKQLLQLRRQSKEFFIKALS